MIIDQLPSISAPQNGDELPIERGTTTYKIDYDAIASAIINKLGGDPVTLAHGGTGAASASAARTNLYVYSKAETDSAIAQSTAAVCTRITGISITTASSGNAQISSSVPSGYVPVFAYLEGIVAPAATEMAVIFRYSQQWYVNIKTVAGTAVSGQDRSIGLICVKV